MEEDPDSTDWCCNRIKIRSITGGISRGYVFLCYEPISLHSDTPQLLWRLSCLRV